MSMIAAAGTSAPGRAARWMPAVALAASAAWIVLAITGGFSWHIALPLPAPLNVSWDLRAHRPGPALVVALAAALACLHRPIRTALPGVTASWWRALDRHAARIAVTASAATLYVALHWGSFVAGSADAYGYVSQAHLWTRGELRVYQPIAHQVSWADADWTFSPLGYRPGRRSGFIVPTYSPGLPLTMAAAAKVAGPPAMFAVVPILGALAVWITFVIGRRVHTPAAAALAAVLVATSPIVLFQIVQPMSDIPVSAWWIASVAAALRRTRCGAALAGLAASAAILTRPNLLPLVAPVGLYVLLSQGRSHGWRRALTAGAIFGAALLPALLAAASINQALYGSPLTSGYGSLSDIYALDNFFPNVRRYSHWVVGSQTWFIALAALSPAVAVWRSRARSADQRGLHLGDSIFFLGFAAVVFACYVFYLVFSDWTYIRFLLPALPLAIVLATIVAVEALRVLPAPLSAPAAILLTTALGAWYVAEARENRTFTFKRDDRHYVDAGQYAARALPPRAVLVAVQESGSLRYYGDRLTLRWDMIAPDRLDATLAELRQKGLPPYLVLESWEEADFRRRFEGHSPLALLDWPPRADIGSFVRVRIYDPSDRQRYLAGEEVQTDRVMPPDQ